MTAPNETPLETAWRLAINEAGGNREDVIAYDFLLVSNRLRRRLVGPPTEQTARIAAIIRAADAEHSRLLHSRGTYGKAG